MIVTYSTPSEVVLLRTSVARHDNLYDQSGVVLIRTSGAAIKTNPTPLITSEARKPYRLLLISSQ